MKHRFLICGIFLGIALLGTAKLIQSVKTHYEQRQEQRQEELQEYIDKATHVCDTAFVYVDLISRARCYERLLG